MSARPGFLPVENSTKPFWHTELHEYNAHRSTEQLPEHSDIVIIGAGYAGTATAYHLVKDKEPKAKALSITILEARDACSGATGRNGGHLRPDYYDNIPKHIERAGVEAGAEVAEFEIAHLWALKELIEKENIDCDFCLGRQTSVFTNQLTADRIRELYHKMSSYNMKYWSDVFYVEGPKAEAITGIKGAKCCLTSTSAHLWPYKLILHLLKSLVEAGEVNLQTNTPVTLVEPSTEGGFTVTTPRGSIHASKVVYASNAYTSGLLPEYSNSIVPCKGICSHITMPEGKRAPLLTMSAANYDELNVMSYLIPRWDGSIVVGGGSRKFIPFKEQWYNNIDDSIIPEAGKDYFDGYMQRTYHGWEETGASIKELWTGVMGYSYDSLPHIGAIPDKPGRFILAGFNGHGMPVIWLASKGLAKMVRDGKEFEEVGLPRLYKTTKERIDKALQNPNDSDIPFPRD